MKLKSIQQGSQYWKRWRKQGIGASDAPAIMGVSPWSTKSDWLQTSLGFQHFRGNARTFRGERLEPFVRAMCNQQLNKEFRAICAEHDDYPWLRASLDGLCMDNEHILEIKCPNDSAHSKAVGGGVPNYYYPQLQHQFLVTGLDRLTYASYSDEPKFKGNELALVEIKPNPDYIATLFRRLQEAQELKEKAIKMLKEKSRK